jgi:glycosyltransferase involved in cell wall biosynthesis
VAATRPGEKPRGSNVLYITYDGLTDPLGGSQILPYLTRLAAAGHQITILSCEKPERMSKDGLRIQELCDQAGICWHPLNYHKRPPILSSAVDAVALQRAAVRLQRKARFDVVHCRSYIPAGAGLALKRDFGIKFLFDMRGFWPDEKAEGNSWNLANPLYAAVYHYFKRLESQLLRGADHIVSLTEAGAKQLRTRKELASGTVPVTVIPCCVDFDHFRLATSESRSDARKDLAIGDEDPVLAYLGSLGSWYMLGEMLDFFQVYASRYDKARFLFVTLDDPLSIRQAAAARGVDPERLIIRRASRDDVPRLMAAADLGIFFIKPVFSKTASSPTKMGEMLAVGLPIIANAGVGDVEQIIGETGCGVAIRDFNRSSYDDALDRLEKLDGTSSGRRDRAVACFDVRMGVERYDRIYRELRS